MLPIRTKHTRPRHFRVIASTASSLALVLLVACATRPEWTTYRGSLDTMRGERWIEDLHRLETELRARHPDPFHGGRDDDYATILAGLLAEVESGVASRTLADTMVTGMARLLATVGEGHTSLNASPDACFPLVTRWFGLEGSRELRVVQTRVVDRAALGHEVVAVAGQPLAAVVPLLDACLSVDHPNGLTQQEPSVLTNPRWARDLGLADAHGLVVRLRRADSSEYVLTVPEVALADLALVDPWTADGKERALPYRRTGERWWSETVGSTLYVQYNTCDLDAYDFFRDVVDTLRDGRLAKMVVDLRRNSGGDSRRGTWFAKAVADIRTVNRTGGITVLIGPRTFSSAMMLAVDLMHHTEALFAGEPLAERVDSWGEVKRFALPNSGLVVGCSTRFFTNSRGKDLRLRDGIVVPDPGLERVTTWQEWSTGVDPVFDLAMR